jgi:type II secretory pathway pseudopilin PulG
VRRGITLVELLLVLALLVVVGSLAAPAVTSSFASVRLRRAGDKVLACWAQARAKAVETGVPCQFRFEPETGKARVEAWTGVPTDGATPTSTATTSPAASTPAAPVADPAATVSSTSPTDSGDMPAIELQLAEPITFYNGQSRVEDPLSHEARVDSLTANRASLSTPILFFPDGSSSQAEVTLVNDRQQYLRLTLRGLTGTARASSVLGRDELDSSTARAR